MVCDERGHVLGSGTAGPSNYQVVGKEQAKASLRAHDGRGPATSLVPRLCQHFGLAEVDDIMAPVYRWEMPPSQIAAFAPVVTQAARQGDEVAAEILCCAGRELALAALAVLRGLSMEGMKVEVAVVGGTLEADEFAAEFQGSHRAGSAQCSGDQPLFRAGGGRSAPGFATGL